MLSRQHKQFYHRAGFGIGVGELTSRTGLPIVQIVEEALKDATQPLPSVEGMNGGSPTLESSFLTRSVEPRFQNMESTSSQLDSLRFEWFEIMCHSGLGLREKMALFWHGHFACQCWQESTARQYLEVLRNHALGNFKTLLRAIVKTPAMIIFLNNQQNRKDHPNENFARELMELFTMGHGTYSEFDVKEAARAFTGWSTDEGGDFVFRPESHDPESKVFLGKKGRLDGEDIVEIILKQPATKLHLARSLYRFFVNEQIDPDAIDQIASYIAETDFDMARVMHYIFTSPFFYDEENQANKIKAPLDLLVQTARLFGMKFHDVWAPTFLQRALGQVMFDPPNVAGWPGGRAWINNSTLMLRLNLAEYLIDNQRFDHAVATPYEAMTANSTVQNIRIQKNMVPIIEIFSGTTFNSLGEKLQSSLLAGSHNLKLMTKKERHSLNYTQRAILRLTSLPEFQMC